MARKDRLARGGGRRPMTSPFSTTTGIVIIFIFSLCCPGWWRRGDYCGVAGFAAIGGPAPRGGARPAFSLVERVPRAPPRDGVPGPSPPPSDGGAMSRWRVCHSARRPMSSRRTPLSASSASAAPSSRGGGVARTSGLNYSNRGDVGGEGGGGNLAYGVAEAISSVRDLEFDVVKEANGAAIAVEDGEGVGGHDGVPLATKVGVLLLNLGGPETSEDVEGFLYNLFSDPDIIRLPGPLAPLQKYIARGITKSRSPKSKEAYASIGGGSPILKYSNAQASLLSDALRDRHGLDATCYVGMRYWHPFTEEALEKIRNDGVNALVVLPLYPQFSISTSGSSLRVLQEEFARRADLYGPARMRHTVVDKWYDRPGYVSSIANLIREELDSFTEEELEVGGGKRHVLFSAHGVPRSYIEAGDPYQTQIRDCVDRISKLLPSEEEGVEVHLSYQSRVGPVEWLRPYTDDVLPELGQDGVKNLVVVPISFVSEHIETLEEIDIEYRELAEESGIENWRRCPALNTDGAFIDDLADLVVDALSEPVQTVTEACIANNCEIELQPFDQRLGIGTNMTEKVVDDAEARDAERINGRLAILGVAGTILIELLSGKSLLHMFGM